MSVRIGTKCASWDVVTYITNPDVQQKELAFIVSVVDPDQFVAYSFPALDNPTKKGVLLSDGLSSTRKVGQNSGNLAILFTDPGMSTIFLRQ